MARTTTQSEDDWAKVSRGFLPGSPQSASGGNKTALPPSGSPEAGTLSGDLAGIKNKFVATNPKAVRKAEVSKWDSLFKGIRNTTLGVPAATDAVVPGPPPPASANTTQSTRPATPTLPSTESSSITMADGRQVWLEDGSAPDGKIYDTNPGVGKTLQPQSVGSGGGALGRSTPFRSSAGLIQQDPFRSSSSGPGMNNMSFGEMFTTGLGLKAARMQANTAAIPENLRLDQEKLRLDRDKLDSTNQNAGIRQESLSALEAAQTAAMEESVRSSSQINNIKDALLAETDPTKQAELEAQLATLTQKTAPASKFTTLEEMVPGEGIRQRVVQNVPMRGGGFMQLEAGQSPNAPQQNQLQAVVAGLSDVQKNEIATKFPGKTVTDPDVLAYIQTFSK